ncbi:hypothetical protein IQ279_05985 [Streptomyces verrucosisporus]|uniref:hypothetical protein n=1 Tax=Streptomyces verrucosisporus TaxID=1695161 RepID=UPI0019CFFF4C|nr:hypothetical protein [Streptomyces verrucosisporus]MBN3929194.1 hypothetical protein [Streptomyces verrucosisporus]
MIEQAYVQAVDRTTPTIQDVRDRISQGVDATAGPALDRLRFWLQMPTDSEFRKMMDNDCLVRAKRVGGSLSPGTGKPHIPSSLSSRINIEGKWAAIDEAVKTNHAVVIKGPAEHVGGSESMFRSSFHVILFLAVGQEHSGRRYYLGFDPDISATVESRAEWGLLIPGDTKEKVREFDDVRSVQVVKAMILGDSQNGFGPLVRKYYVETGKAFPSISLDLA